MSRPVVVPLLNANEDELQVVRVLVAEGDQVKEGDLLAVLESTKASMELESPAAGFVRRIHAAAGDSVKVGRTFLLLTDSPDEELEEAAEDVGPAPRATKEAVRLAEEHGIALSSLDKVDGRIIRARDVLAAAGGRHARAPFRPDNQILLWGAGGHARTLAELIRGGQHTLRLAGVVDDGDNPPGDVSGIPMLGTSRDLEALRERGFRYAALGIGAVTNNAARVPLFERLVAAGFELPSWIHKDASVEQSVVMGRANQIFAGSVVGSHVVLHDNVIVNSGAVISHDCEIGSHSHITPGAILAGAVTVGRNTVIGMGATIYIGVTIGDDVVIANGQAVMGDVASGTIVRAGL